MYVVFSMLYDLHYFPQMKISNITAFLKMNRLTITIAMMKKFKISYATALFTMNLVIMKMTANTRLYEHLCMAHVHNMPRVVS